MLATYLMWALSETTPPGRGTWLSALPLAAALVRFGVLTARRTVRPVEDLITRDAVMLCCEVGMAGPVLRRPLRGVREKENEHPERDPARFSRVLLLGGTSEIGLAILSPLHLGPGAEVILAGRDPQRLEAAGKSLGRPVDGGPV